MSERTEATFEDRLSSSLVSDLRERWPQHEQAHIFNDTTNKANCNGCLANRAADEIARLREIKDGVLAFCANAQQCKPDECEDGCCDEFRELEQRVLANDFTKHFRGDAE